MLQKNPTKAFEDQMLGISIPDTNNLDTNHERAKEKRETFFQAVLTAIETSLKVGLIQNQFKSITEMNEYLGKLIEGREYMSIATESVFSNYKPGVAAATHAFTNPGTDENLRFIKLNFRYNEDPSAKLLMEVIVE